MSLAFSHVGICVSDLERSRRFYVEGLGFAPAHELEVSGRAAEGLLELPGVQLRAVYLTRDGVTIELLDYPAPGVVGTGEARPMNRLGLTHLSLRTDDLDGLAARLASLGGTVLDATRVENRDLGAVAIFVLDPDGTRIELVAQGP